ncbi:ABC transporter type 1, transmembrane domain-containing protein [Phakopsora pachyrhizi]|nr:ABC transporter type 1, transmembrane domain-containing protein [Phakopsora pachyrhizi]
MIDILTDPQLADSLSISLPTAAALLTGFFLIGPGANTTRIILTHIAGQRIIRRLRISTFGAILRADMSWHDLRSSAPSVTPTSNLVSRLGSNCNIAGDSITRDLTDGSRALITTISGVFMMLFISSKLTLLMLTVVFFKYNNRRHQGKSSHTYKNESQGLTAHLFREFTSQSAQKLEPIPTLFEPASTHDTQV